MGLGLRVTLTHAIWLRQVLLRGQKTDAEFFHHRLENLPWSCYITALIHCAPVRSSQGGMDTEQLQSFQYLVRKRSWISGSASSWLLHWILGRFVSLPCAVGHHTDVQHSQLSET